MNRRAEILAKIQSVEAMPASSVEVMRVLQDPDSSVSTIAAAIEIDPGLTSNVLRLVNSAYYGFAREIRTVAEAVIRLGATQVMNSVVISAVAPLSREAVKGYDLAPGKLWERSVIVAVGAQQIAKTMNLQPPHYMFTAAILHDIGKIVLGTFIEVDAEPIMDLAYSHGVPFEMAEQTILGIDHAEVGGELLVAWNLPKCLSEVARWHHQPEARPKASASDQLVMDLINVSDILSLMVGLGTGSDGMNYSPSVASVSRLGLKIRDMEKIISQTLAEFNELQGSFI